MTAERQQALRNALEPLRTLSAPKLYDSEEILIVADGSAPWRANAEILQVAASLRNPCASLAVINARGELCKISQYLPADEGAAPADLQRSDIPPELQQLKADGDQHFERGEWQEALTCYQSLLERFAGSESTPTPIMILEAKKKLALVYNELHLFTAAKPLWDALGPEESKDLAIVKGAALCYGGWLEPKNGGFVEIEGTGDTVRALELWSRLFVNAFRGRDAKYSSEWWEMKFMTIYTRYRAGFTDPMYMQQARALLDSLKAKKPDLGGDPVRQKFLWLEEQLE
ncbi:MAG: hypothetical protein AB1486_01320 [Planctomycetota bacterium]